MLVHQDTEIVDADFCRRVRDALSDPTVGVAGCVGAIGVRSIAWWEGSVTLSSFANRYEEHGGGELPGFSWDWDEAPPYAQVGEVDTLDGFLLVLSPWTVRNVRFDEELSEFHGYDLDFCLQVREAGRRVITADLRADPSPPARDAAATSRPGWRRTCGSPRSGTAACPASGRRRAAGRSGRGGPRPSATPPGRSRYTKRLELQARRLQVERALDEARGSISWRADRALSPARAAVIVFACGHDGPEAYRRYAAPGIRMAAEDDSKIHAFAAVGSVCRSYNLLLERAALEPDLEALVLVQQDVEILDPDFCGKVRRALEDPERGRRGPGRCDGGPHDRVVGRRHQRCAASSSATSSSGAARSPPSRGSATSRRRPRSRWWTAACWCCRPWAVETLRFDESLSLGLRLRARPLPAGARRRTQGGDRRPARGLPDALAEDGDRHGPLDRGAHPGGREARGPASGRRHRRGGLEGARPPGRGRARGGPHARLLHGAPGGRRDGAAGASARRAHREHRPGGSPRRSAG